LTQPLLVATRNRGKLRELASLLSNVPMRLVSLDEAGVDGEVEETGATFEENAVLKATAYAKASGLTTLADDSGLEVDALGGEPGVRSARYAGAGADDGARVKLLLSKLRGASAIGRQARFRCAIAVASPNGPVRTFAGVCEGTIADAPRGRNGFGYDPVFLLPEMGKTMAELSDEEKDAVSHRGMAARRAAAALREPDFMYRLSSDRGGL
jgi:XTP/dITP diphosphohydrolase